MIILPLLFGMVSSKNLVTMHSDLKSSNFPGCKQPDVETCVRAEIDLDLLKTSDTVSLPLAPNMTMSRRGLQSVVFVGEQSEAVFAWRGDHVAGHLNAEGRSWILEGCGPGCYLWILQTNNWVDETHRNTTSSVRSSFRSMKTESGRESLRTMSEEDTSTVVTYSIMIWTTPQFEALFSSVTDMETFIDLVFEETNQGYINSEMPVRAVLHDIKSHPTLVDIQDSSQLVNDFEDSMSQSDLLNCADSAALLIEDFDSCGIANFGVTSSCRSFSVTKKSCATGYYSFGHEIGHNFGAHHDPAQFTSGTSGDKYGHWILPTGDTQFSGYRTILAYSGFGHYNRVNYYSNPDVNFPTTGTPTGVTGLSNNARVITAGRFEMAACGTEEPNGQCNDCNIHPEAEPCLTCCTTVELTGTSDGTFITSGYKTFAGSYTLYTSNPTLNDRNVYKQDGSDYCLYYSNNAWRIVDCSNVGSGSYYVKSSATSKKCPHGGDLVWQYSSTQDTTMKYSCTTACSSSPPTSPTDRTSDWDGSSLTAGTVVTYTCTSGSCIPLSSVCDPSSLVWKPASLSSAASCSSCGGSGVTSGVTTLPPTTTQATTMAPTYCGSGGLPAFSTTKMVKKIKTGLDCQKYCAGITDSTYFKWKTHKKVTKRVCWCLKVIIKVKNKYESGPVTC